MEKKGNSTYSRFIKIGHIEGISYLILLFIAMPVKYYAGIPEAVTVIGYLHGVLFVLYCIMLALVMQKLKWNLQKGVLAFILSLIPFGTFYLNRIKP